MKTVNNNKLDIKYNYLFNSFGRCVIIEQFDSLSTFKLPRWKGLFSPSESQTTIINLLGAVNRLEFKTSNMLY